jgi:hypothetical protein
MLTELLWMNEDELREQCCLLVEALLESEIHRVQLINNMGQAVAHGYKRGYTEASVQLQIASQKRDAESHTVH